MSDRYEGGCFCGALRFSFEPPSLWCAHCHCTMCRRSHGAAFVTWVGIAENSFSFDRDNTLRWYQSSVDAQRGFCGDCGSTVFFRSQRWPGEIHVVRACFDGVIDREPEAHVFWESHVSWLDIDGRLPRKSGS